MVLHGVAIQLVQAQQKNPVVDDSTFNEQKLPPDGLKSGHFASGA
jgi:hypothetical protein